jgi:putative Holliday junction resolvase
MKYIGIDYGKKRVGLAVSDEAGQFALPKEVLQNDEKLVQTICSLAKEIGAEAVVVGESKDYKGKDNLIMEKIAPFKSELEALGIKVILEPEFMTSFAAQRFQGKNALHDASAAALILQSFLDRKNKQKSGGDEFLLYFSP